MEASANERIIVLIDMDCFYVQVEQKLNRDFASKPCAVVQYTAWQGGGIIAVNYEAREYGVKRGMQADEAKELCPSLYCYRVPKSRGKADLTRYREAGTAVLAVLCEFCDTVERASVDEAYLDLTSKVNEKMSSELTVCAAQIPNTYVVGWNKESQGDDVDGWLDNIYEEHTLSDQRLAVAAILVEEIRTAVFDKLKFRCSAGIAHNKMLAKLACGLHKPNKQTIIPRASVPALYNTIPVQKVNKLGGKLGAEVKRKLNITTFGQLMRFTKLQLFTNFGEKTGSWLYSLSRGIDNEPVIARRLPKSIGCGKHFTGNALLDTKAKISHWVSQLASELEERLIKDQLDNHRAARAMIVTLRNKDDNGNVSMMSRTCPVSICDARKLASDSLRAIQKFNSASTSSSFWEPPVVSLALSAGKFEDKVDVGCCSIDSYFRAAGGFNKAFNFGTSSEADEEDKSDDTSESEVEAEISHSRNTGAQPIGTISSYFNKYVTKRMVEERNNDSHVEQPHRSTATTASSAAGTSAAGTSAAGTNVADTSAVDTNAAGTSAESENHENIFLDTGPSRSAKPPKGFFARKLEERKMRLKKSSIKMIEMEDEDIANMPIVSIYTIEKPEFSSHKFRKDIAKVADNKEKKSDVKLSVYGDHEIENSSESSNSLTPDSSEMLHNQQEISLPPELLIICAICHQEIPARQEQEHSDFHKALSLQDKAKVVCSSGLKTAVSDVKNESRKRAACSDETHKESKLPKK